MIKKSLAVFIGLVSLYMYLSYANYYSFLGKNHQNCLNENSIQINKTSETKKIVFLGDSLGCGAGVKSIDQSWPYLLANKFTTSTSLQIMAIPGANSADIILASSQISAQQPDFVFVEIGTNDVHNFVSPTDFESHINQILTNLEQSKAKIILFNIPFLTSIRIIHFPWNYILDSRIKTYNQILSKFSSSRVRVVDIYTPTRSAFFTNPDLYSSDNFHPNPAGYDLLSKIYAN